MKQSIKMQVIVLLFIACPVMAGIISAEASLNGMSGITGLNIKNNASANCADSVTAGIRAPATRRFYDEEYLVRLYHRYR